MNVQTHMSGQFSGQIPNQAGTQLPGLPQQNGLSLSNQIQNLGDHGNTLNMETEFAKARRFIQDKIYEYFMKRQQAHDIHPKKLMDIVRRLDEGLFRNAGNNKDEYLNLETLENRLHVLIKCLPMINHNQPYPQLLNSSSPIGTMIPTPGIPHGGTSSRLVASSVDTSMISTGGDQSMVPATLNTGSFVATSNGSSVGMHGGSFCSSDGSMSKGYQHSRASFSMNSGGNSGVSSTGVQRMTSQMIPTPGFNANNNPPYMNMESSNNTGAFSTVESTMASHPLEQKQHAGGQNNRILHNLGSHMSGGLRSGLQQKSNEFPNGSLGMMRSSSQLLNCPGTSEGYLTATPYGSSPKPLHHYDQHQRPLMQGDGYGMNTPVSSGPGSVYGPLMSSGSPMNNQNLNPANLQSMSRTNPPLMTNQSNLLTTQQASNVRLQSIDQPEKMNILASNSFRENLLQSHHQHQFQQHPHQSQQHFVQQKQQFQPHGMLLKNESFGHSQLASDLCIQLKPEHGIEYNNDAMHSQVSEKFQFSELQNQLRQNSADINSGGTQLLSLPSVSQDKCSSLTQSSQPRQQLLHPHQLVVETQNDFSCLSVGGQAERLLPGQWHPKSRDRSQIPGNLSHEPNIQEEFHQRITGQDEAQRNKLSSEGSLSQTAIIRTADLTNSCGATCRSGNPDRERQFRNQQRWLLFLRHARRCMAPEGKCQEVNCITAQNLWKHVDRCNVPRCPDLRCHQTKMLLQHYKDCRDLGCPVCVPVKNFVEAQLQAHARLDSKSGMPSSTNGSYKSYDTADSATRLTSRISPPFVVTSEDLQSSMKRVKMEQPSQSLVCDSESSILSVPASSEFHVLHDARREYQHGDTCMSIKAEVIEVKREVPSSSRQENPNITDAKKGYMDDAYDQKPIGERIISHNSAGSAQQESIRSEKEMAQSKEECVLLPAENASGTKSGKPKIKGVSLTELFTPEQVREHIMGLRQWVGQSKAKAEKNQAMEHSMSENSCQLCAVEKLTFEPPPIYCSPCGARIKRNAMYYTIGAGDTRHFFCIPCHNEARGDTILVDGTSILKARLEKRKNDEETEEWWVQCDKCEAWQHQICALFNGRRNDGGQAEYTCPNCYIAEIERGERMPLPQSAVLGAKDLPRTILSDRIEQRLFRRLKQERQERARFQGKSYDEVPGAEALVVRVVSSVDKKLDVKQRFLEIFQEDNYPTEFPYKSKVVLLFQKIEGVEVCLFGMYVQEFGSECQQPNHRRVYLSYLDSVKYFRPEIKAVTGEALRTFVYHEILIGYLEYCKKRGFTSCYIWACPPLKGEDYILYCHPEIQKTPKSDKLREWYLSMLRKAAKENIVVELTNLYDHFFIYAGERKAKVTAARLPYFDGDYWPGAAEDMIYQLRQEEDGRKQHKKGITKKPITKRALKASGHSDLSGNASKDLLLMQKLGETIIPMKEDFIMVHLQPACTHCCILMVIGNRWTCNQCKDFQLCDKCYEAEQKLEEKERHPINLRDKHVLYPVEINDVPEDTKDTDDILESEFFDTRQAFLSLCQGNHYQYDTLRRAKHSSMMVLYHLHNPTAPAFVTTCNACHLDIEAGQGWRCEICPDYDVCNACYQKDGGIDHPHKLTNHPSMADRDAQNTEARELRVLQLRKMLDLLVHASQCRSSLCQYPNCRKVKGLFRHGIQCKTRASGGCLLCKKMWYLLQLHARACKESECHVPRCRDLKEHMRRLQQQSDSRRRAAVMEMMRQRAAEVAGNAG
ncbi:histone acetyltransferase HAC1-like isoform X1 [Rhododendron vialii]|uniref:histone acetyltransferase HAC1-like isoform X1 n=1 Tax=Rhododendron vialii TaxID=182163 RepID=UPI00265E2DA0|nr:histone acetyltransferase HAC1-like isoform X1 [Rhododendron vialii]XP_058180698.1 histone acetyltransferase HAC1-like isoform X1 [Rhododendron vialii]